LRAGIGQGRGRSAGPVFCVAALAGARVVPEECPAIPVLHPVQKGRGDEAPAIDKGGIAARQVQQRGVAGAERHRGVGRQAFVNAKALGKIRDGRHADVLANAGGDH
ncbi:hypothetical protein RZS08_67630, partial [Arthrospira platensis SPKY1]|nr:hypothetical protein [Arthrospira platensis SPKY1]